MRPHHHEHSSSDHVKFDEEIISEHDKDRGTRQKIDEPKTPYQYDQEDAIEEELSEQTQQVQQQSEDVHMVDEVVVKEIDAEVRKHLEEAEKNKELNAQLLKEQQAAANFHIEHPHQKDFGNELTKQLDAAQHQIEDEEQSKISKLAQFNVLEHAEFEKKRKDHYKNEFSPAMLLKQKIPMDDDEEEEEK